MSSSALTRGLYPRAVAKSRARPDPSIAPARPVRLLSRNRVVFRFSKRHVVRAASSDVSPSTREASARIQKDLANRLLVAQTGWVRNGRVTPSGDDTTSDASREQIGNDDDAANEWIRIDKSDSSSKDSSDDSDSTLYSDPNATVLEEATSRGQWLLGLLVLQSSSSIVLENYGDLIKNHLEITLFLTMLVGAGGNAGNQSAIRVIRGLATGDFVVTKECALSTMWRQTRVGIVLATVLAGGGFLRVIISRGAFFDPADDVVGDATVIAMDTVSQVAGVTASIATQATQVTQNDNALTAAIGISSSLFVIVTTSTLTGSALPFLLAFCGQDPANAGTTIQVLMDVLGVVITCVVCAFVFEYFSGVGVVLSVLGG